MWEPKEPKPAKLIVGVLAPDERCLKAAIERLVDAFGDLDMVSEIWPFTQTQYYADEIGQTVLRQFVTMEKLVHPGQLAAIKHRTNRMEQDLAASLGLAVPRPVNLDPGLIEPSKLILASTKNFSHRIYIGDRMYAEVTLLYDKGHWCSMQYTFPDYKQDRYHAFFSKVRARLVEQLRGYK